MNSKMGNAVKKIIQAKDPEYYEKFCHAVKHHDFFMFRVTPNIETYKTLNIVVVHGGLVSVSHYYMQNRDPMNRDLIIDAELIYEIVDDCLNPVEYKNKSLGIRETLKTQLESRKEYSDNWAMDLLKYGYANPDRNEYLIYHH
jgi:hypothetical protein